MVSGTILFFVIQKIEWNQLLIFFKQGNLVFLFLGVLFGIIFNLVKFLKWYLLIITGNNKHSYWDAAKSYMIGNTLGIITPMRAGDLARSLYFSLENRPRVIGLTIIDRVTDLIAVFFFSIAGGFVLINNGLGTLLVLITIASFSIIFSSAMYTFLQGALPRNNIGEKLKKILTMFPLLSTKTVVISLIISFISFSFIILQFYSIITAFEKTRLISVYLATPLITLSTLIPVTFMGLGVREGLSVYLFSKLGISKATGFSVAFLGFFINNVTTSLIGLVLLSKVNLSGKNLSNKAV